jgi:hypothetical protein
VTPVRRSRGLAPRGADFYDKRKDSRKQAAGHVGRL